MTKATSEKGKETDAEKVTAWSWRSPSAYRCPRCGSISLSKELAAPCPVCRFTEGM